MSTRKNTRWKQSKQKQVKVLKNWTFESYALLPIHGLHSMVSRSSLFKNNFPGNNTFRARAEEIRFQAVIIIAQSEAPSPLISLSKQKDGQALQCIPFYFLKKKQTVVASLGCEIGRLTSGEPVHGDLWDPGTGGPHGQSPLRWAKRAFFMSLRRPAGQRGSEPQAAPHVTL